ncbi:hypothetical protein Tco_1103145 [Tanacetum coccineum]
MWCCEHHAEITAMVNDTTHVLIQSQELQREDVATLCGWMLLLDRQHLKVILRELLHVQVILRELLHDQVILHDLHRISEWQSAQIVVRVANGLHWRDNVAKVVKQVMMSRLGQVVREKAKKLSLDMSAKGHEEIDEVVQELLQLCKSGSSRRGRGYVLQKTKSEGFPIDYLSEFIHEEEEEKQEEY